MPRTSVLSGHCKEGRPLPVVQMGLFMDHDGFPLAMCIEPGNRAETSTLKPMEEILKDKFGLSKLVVCTDGGLSSYDNRKNDSIGDRAFITVQSLKKLKQDLQKWALDSKGWHVDGSDKEYDISTLDEKEHYDTLFFKEIWDPTPMSTGETLEQRIIVTFSLKYRDYLAHVRNRQVTRAMALLEKGKGATSKRKSPNDAKRFIKAEHCTTDGELAQIESFSLNQEMIDQESRFDGFYALCTVLKDPAPIIIKLNSGRWIIENGFRIMKTDFEARPVYVRRDDRIKAHFLTCFFGTAYIQVSGKEGQPWRQALHNRGDSQYFALNELPQYSRRRICSDIHPNGPHQPPSRQCRVQNRHADSH